MRFKLVLSFFCTEAAVFIIAPFAPYFIADPAAAAGVRLVLLPLILFPVMCYAAGFVTQLVCGFSPALPILTFAAFAPAALLHYSLSALTYAAVYAGVCCMGLITAYPVRALREMRRGSAGRNKKRHIR